MKEVLLSHDSKVLMYSVPDEVADRLKDYFYELPEEYKKYPRFNF